MTPPRRRVLSTADFRRGPPEPSREERERRFAETPWPAEVRGTMERILGGEKPDLGKTRLTVDISPTLHHALKKAAVDRRMTVRALVLEALAKVGIRE